MTDPTPRAGDEKRSDMNADMRRRAAEIPPWLLGECDPTPADAARWIVSLWGDLDANQSVRQRGQKGTAAFVARAYLDGRGELARLREGLSKQNDEVCQTLGKALGYPWFKDDQQTFPGATEANGVYVGEHIAETLAAEAAAEIERLRFAIAYAVEMVSGRDQIQDYLRAALAGRAAGGEGP